MTLSRLLSPRTRLALSSLVVCAAAHAAPLPSASPAAPVSPALPPAAATPMPAPAESSVPDRWATAFDGFAREDAERPPKPGGVVFVGSSSIRLWADLPGQFADWPVVIKRGFGGSQMRDCVHYVKRLIAPYRPKLVVVYAGDNDIEAGRTPQQVLADFQAFVAGARAQQPGLPIAFISIKPSPARKRLMARVREANRLIRDYAERTDGLRYVDVFSQMLDADGQPRADLFSPDELHMNASGYALWKSTIARSLGELSPPPAAAAAAH